jgi:hypothetical protein
MVTGENRDGRQGRWRGAIGRMQKRPGQTEIQAITAGVRIGVFVEPTDDQCYDTPPPNHPNLPTRRRPARDARS